MGSKIWDAPKSSSDSGVSLPPLLPTLPTFKRLDASLGGKPNSLPIKRLIVAQMQERRERGLCFNCDERFHAGHRCKAKFFLLIMDDDDLDDSLPLVLEDPIIEEEPEVAAISMHVLTGHLNLSTIRLRGRLQGREMEVLIDGGSTHNFMQERVAKHLGLTITDSPNFMVMIGNGDKLRCSGTCSAVKLELDGQMFYIDFFVLSIKGADIVLGAQWLATLGPVVMDCKASTMSFTWAGKSLTLRGRQRHQMEPLHFHQLERCLKVDSIAETFSLFSLNFVDSNILRDSVPSTEDDIPLPVLLVLDSFAENISKAHTIASL